MGGWYRDRERIERGREQLSDNRPEGAFTRMLFVPTMSAEQLRQHIQGIIAVARNPRFAALMHQWGAELAAFHGHDELALEYMQAAADGVLVDLQWLEHCPLFASLREHPRYETVRQIVRRRAEAVWATPTVKQT